MILATEKSGFRFCVTIHLRQFSELLTSEGGREEAEGGRAGGEGGRGKGRRADGGWSPEEEGERKARVGGKGAEGRKGEREGEAVKEGWGRGRWEAGDRRQGWRRKGG